jgi:hypothetical protein
MTGTAPFRLAFAAAALLAAPANLAAAAAAPAESVWRASADDCVEIDGTYAPDARVLVTDVKGRILVDLPSLSIGLVVNMRSRKAVKVSRWSLKYDGAGGDCRLAEPIPSDAPTCEMSIEGQILRFRIDASDVRVLKASSCHPTVTPYWAGASVTDDSSARRCLRQEERSLRDTPGCTKGAYLKNSCEAPVVGVVRTIQHLFSGDLSETSSIVVPPRVDHSLGCVWSSGAMAPSEFDLLAAAFLPKPAGSGPGHRGATAP